MNAAATARTVAYLPAVVVATPAAATWDSSPRVTPAGPGELLRRAEVALASGNPRAAHEAWEAAYRQARHARAADDLLAVGHAYLRIGEAIRDRPNAVASARQVFLTALLQARERREAAGVAAAAAAFAALGDGEMADRGFEIATATAIERGDTAARERVSSTPYTTEEILLHGKERLADFKVPAHIEFGESLPESPAGKILRGQL